MRVRTVLSIAMAILLTPVTVMPGAARAAEKLGNVHFPVSCSRAAQSQFERAVALLHSFWYEEAVKAFTVVTETDPSCAMGYWGIAMSMYYPLWQPPSAATLQKGWATVEKAKAAGAKTARERDYIAAIEAFYKDADRLDHRTRAVAYEKAMESVYVRNPKDNEAAVFYALALDSTADPSDKTYTNQLKAATILEKVYREEPNHPGVAHYLIHSYDYPSLANRALVPARSYAKIAPSVPHAQHMPSHIFTRLGLWEESIQSNTVSAAAGREYARKSGWEGAWPEQLHAMDYLAYAYLQTGQDQKAQGVLDELRSIRKAEPENFAAAYAFAAIPARVALERHRWSEAAALAPHPAEFPWKRFQWGEAITSFARALGAARSGEVATARQDADKLQALRDSLVQAQNAYWADQVEIQRRAALGWIALAEGKNDDAVTLMRSAADLEDASDKHPVTPGAILPARELLGSMLLELKQPAPALREFETSMGREPNRYNGIYGVALAAELSGDLSKAKTYYARLVTLCDKADTERPELHHARVFLAGR